MVNALHDMSSGLQKFIFTSLFVTLYCSPSILFPLKVFLKISPQALFIFICSQFMKRNTHYKKKTLQVMTLFGCSADEQCEGPQAALTPWVSTESNADTAPQAGTRYPLNSIAPLKLPLPGLADGTDLTAAAPANWLQKVQKRGITRHFPCLSPFSFWFLGVCQLLINVRQKQPLVPLIDPIFTWVASPTLPQSDYEIFANLRWDLSSNLEKSHFFPIHK